jgi:hypothetical protein
VISSEYVASGGFCCCAVPHVDATFCFRSGEKEYVLANIVDPRIAQAIEVHTKMKMIAAKRFVMPQPPVCFIV